MATALLFVGLFACESEPTTVAPPSSATSATAAEPTATAGTSAPATTSATTSEPAADPCKDHGLALGGTGTRADMCKFEGEVLKASYAGRIDDAGAVIRVENPWREKVTWLSAAVYYFDAEGKQLTIEVGEKEHRAARVEGVEVNIAGAGTTDLSLGFPKENLPSEVDTVEVQILAFGWQADDEGAYFASTAPYREHRAIRGGDGPTGIGPCDEYRRLLESCPKQFPDALTAMRKSLRDYNNATPQTQKTLAEQLSTTCEKAIASVAERCTPE
jgi:hypothetical protein